MNIVDKNLTTAQKDYFKDSKIRDKDGNLMVCQHGAAKDFAMFSSDMIKEDNKLGYGFYFTAGKDLALDWNVKIKAYIDLKNPMTDTSDLLKGEKFNEFCREMKISATCISKMASRGHNTDLDKYQDLCNDFKGSKSALLHYMKEIVGVDGIYSENRGTVVAFIPNQIKSIDNKYPTPDMYFKDNTAQYLKTNFQKLSVAEHLELSKKIKMEKDQNQVRRPTIMPQRNRNQQTIE